VARARVPLSHVPLNLGHAVYAAPVERPTIAKRAREARESEPHGRAMCESARRRASRAMYSGAGSRRA